MALKLMKYLRKDITQIIIGLSVFGIMISLSFFYTDDPFTYYGIALLFLAIYMWILTPISYIFTTFMIISFSVLLGIFQPEEAFGGFASSTIFFLLGAFILALTVQKHNLHKRIALEFLKRFGDSPKEFILGITLVGSLLSMMMPAHGVAALFIPILLGIFSAYKEDIFDSNFVKASLLALSYGTSVGSMGTLLGGARNPLAIGIYYQETGKQISFIGWFIAAIPLVIFMTIMVYLVLTKLFKIEKIDMDNIHSQIQDEVEELGDISTGEKKAIFFLVLAFLSWAIWGQIYGMGVIAVLITVVIAMTKTVSWDDIAKRLPWGTIFLYGGAISLAYILSDAGTLLFVTETLLKFVGDNPFLVLALFAVLAVFLSNVMSNAATTAVILPIGITIMVTIGFSDIIPVYTIALASAFAFMLPVGTPSAALVYTTGHLDMKDFIKAGFILNIIGILSFLTIGLGWWRLIGLW